MQMQHGKWSLKATSQCQTFPGFHCVKHMDAINLFCSLASKLHVPMGIHFTERPRSEMWGWKWGPGWECQAVSVTDAPLPPVFSVSSGQALLKDRLILGKSTCYLRAGPILFSQASISKQANKLAFQQWKHLFPKMRRQRTLHFRSNFH